MCASAEQCPLRPESDHSRHESEMARWAIRFILPCEKQRAFSPFPTHRPMALQCRERASSDTHLTGVQCFAYCEVNKLAAGRNKVCGIGAFAGAAPDWVCTVTFEGSCIRTRRSQRPFSRKWS